LLAGLGMSMPGQGAGQHIRGPPEECGAGDGAKNGRRRAAAASSRVQTFRGGAVESEGGPRLGISGHPGPGFRVAGQLRGPTARSPAKGFALGSGAPPWGGPGRQAGPFGICQQFSRWVNRRPARATAPPVAALLDLGEHVFRAWLSRFASGGGCREPKGVPFRHTNSGRGTARSGPLRGMKASRVLGRQSFSGRASSAWLRMATPAVCLLSKKKKSPGPQLTKSAPDWAPTKKGCAPGEAGGGNEGSFFTGAGRR